MFIYIYYISRAEFEKGDNRIRTLTMLAFCWGFLWLMFWFVGILKVILVFLLQFDSTQQKSCTYSYKCYPFIEYLSIYFILPVK